MTTKHDLVVKQRHVSDNLCITVFAVRVLDVLNIYNP